MITIVAMDLFLLRMLCVPRLPTGALYRAREASISSTAEEHRL